MSYDPKFVFDPSTQNYLVVGPGSSQVAHDIAIAFSRDIDGKMRQALIDLGWCPPDVLGEFKAAFRVNMLRRALPGENIDAEIDRVLALFPGGRR